MKNLIFLLLALSLVGSTQAVSRNKPDNHKQIPILAWYGIPPEQTTLERYRELKESGITLNLTSFPDAQSMEKALNIARKTGIKMIVSCPELKTQTTETVRRFRKHTATAGYMLRDEPSRADFPELGSWAKKIQEEDHAHFCYLNLFPNYASEMQLGTKTYQEHVDLFIKEVPVQLLSFDHYPVIGNSLRPEWYQNLEIFSEAAGKAGKPFWAFALAVAHGPYPIPTLAQLRLQVFSDLAYGAQGIQYFTYWTPVDTLMKFNNGPITAEGQKTTVYDKLKQVNTEIQSLSAVFLGAKVISVQHTGNTIPLGTKPLEDLPPFIKALKTEGTGAVVSWLQNGPETYIVIVNRDFENSMKLFIECDSQVQRVLKNGSSVVASSYAPTLMIEPGDIVLFKRTNAPR
jgi:hypothetical protein